MDRYYVSATVRFLSPADGGRPCTPVGDGYAPYVRSQSLQEDLAVRLLRVPADAQFNEDCTVDVELTYHPRVDYGGLREDPEFQMVEGNRVVGTGRVVSRIFCEHVD